MLKKKKTYSEDLFSSSPVVGSNLSVGHDTLFLTPSSDHHYEGEEVTGFFNFSDQGLYAGDGNILTWIGASNLQPNYYESLIRILPRHILRIEIHQII